MQHGLAERLLGIELAIAQFDMKKFHELREGQKVLHENQLLILKKLEHMAKTLADLQADVTAEDALVDKALVLLQGLAAQVAALQPNQAAIDALAADIEAKTADLTAALAAPPPPATDAP